MLLGEASPRAAVVLLEDMEEFQTEEGRKERLDQLRICLFEDD